MALFLPSTIACYVFHPIVIRVRMCWHSFSLIAYRKGSAEHDWGSISIFIYLSFKCNTHLNHDAILPNEQTHPNNFYGYSSLMLLFPIWIIQIFWLFWFDVNIVLAVYFYFPTHFLWLIFQLTFRKNCTYLAMNIHIHIHKKLHGK